MEFLLELVESVATGIEMVRCIEAARRQVVMDIDRVVLRIVVV
jgi:hypothetical protein